MTPVQNRPAKIIYGLHPWAEWIEAAVKNQDWAVKGFGDWSIPARVAWIRATERLGELDDRVIAKLAAVVEKAMTAGELMPVSGFIVVGKNGKVSIKPEVDSFFITPVRIFEAGLEHEDINLPSYRGNRLAKYRAFAALALGLLVLARHEPEPKVVAARLCDVYEALGRAGAATSQTTAGKSESKDPATRRAKSDLNDLVDEQLESHSSFPELTPDECFDLADQLFMDHAERVKRALKPDEVDGDRDYVEAQTAQVRTRQQRSLRGN